MSSQDSPINFTARACLVDRGRLTRFSEIWRLYVFVGFEVFTAVNTKNAVPWDVEPCVLLEPTFRRNLSFPYCFHADVGDTFLRNVGSNKTRGAACHNAAFIKCMFTFGLAQWQ
jgi:hypothetical protein